MAASANGLWDSGGEQDLHRIVETATPGRTDEQVDVGAIHEVAGEKFFELTQPPPLTFAFQTRNGNLGVLQVIRYTDDPQGIRIRYKMARSTRAKETAGKPSLQNRQKKRLRFLRLFTPMPGRWLKS